MTRVLATLLCAAHIVSGKGFVRRFDMSWCADAG